jgi:hypothetical protein
MSPELEQWEREEKVVCEEGRHGGGGASEAEPEKRLSVMHLCGVGATQIDRGIRCLFSCGWSNSSRSIISIPEPFIHMFSRDAEVRVGIHPAP